MRASSADRIREIGFEVRTARTITRDVGCVLRSRIAHPPAMLATLPDRLDAALRALESAAEVAELGALAEQLVRMSDSSGQDDQVRGRGDVT